jgi:hypothetical protein
MVAGDANMSGETDGEVEARYRTLLRLLPGSYRQAHGDRLLAGWVQGAAERSRIEPTTGEWVAVLALSVRARLGGVGADPRSVARAEVVRLVAVLGLLVHAALSVQELWTLVPSSALLDGVTRDGAVVTSGLWGLTGGRLWVLSIPAYLALLGGRVRTAGILAVLSAVPSLTQLGERLLNPMSGAGTSPAVAVALLFGQLATTTAICLPVAAVLAGFHPAAPRLRPAPWLAAAVLVAGGVVVILPRLFRWAPWAASGPAVYGWLLLAAGLGCTAVQVVAPERSTRRWPTALTVLAIPVLVAQVAMLIVYRSYPQLGHLAGPAVGHRPPSWHSSSSW